MQARNSPIFQLLCLRNIETIETFMFGHFLKVLHTFKILPTKLLTKCFCPWHQFMEALLSQDVCKSKKVKSSFSFSFSIKHLLENKMRSWTQGWKTFVRWHAFSCSSHALRQDKEMLLYKKPWMWGPEVEFDFEFSLLLSQILFKSSNQTFIEG